jgi:uncharacterized protein with PQ loop repeat
MQQEKFHHHIIDTLAFVNAFVSAVSLFPQLYILVFSTNGKENVSLLSYFLIFLNNIVWLVYGIHRKTPPVTISALLNIVASGAILFLLLKV